MAGLQIEKLTKAELRRINRDALDFLKSRSGNKMELEFHMENIASAMSGKFDWLNPEANPINLTSPIGPNRYHCKDFLKSLGYLTDSSSTKIFDTFNSHSKIQKKNMLLP